MTETKAEVELLVEQAAEFLDGHASGWWGGDWESPIDLDKLDMSSTYWCVAGQAFRKRTEQVQMPCTCCTPTGYGYLASILDASDKEELLDAFALDSAKQYWVALITHRRAVYRQQVPEAAVAPHPKEVTA